MQAFLYLIFIFYGCMATTALPKELIVAGVPIITLKDRIGSFTPSERAELIEKRIQGISKDRFFSLENLKIAEGPAGTDILAKDIVLLTITDNDSRALARNRQLAAEIVLRNIHRAIEADRLSRTPKDILTRIIYALTATFILVIFLLGFNYSYKKIYAYINRRVSFSIKISTVEILSAESVKELILVLIRWIRILIILAVLYFYVPLALSFFPLTANLAPQILSHLLEPVKSILKSFVGMLPDIISLVFIIVITRFALRFIRLFFIRIERGSIEIKGFYSEWADPTYKLVRILITALALVAAFPYIPGSKSPAFQAVSVFLGVLVSLGSSSAISNVVAGIVLTYMRPFKMGDRVKIADTMGDVIEKSLLVTRIRTVKNVEITIPSSMTLGSHIINYSRSARDLGLILHTEVTIGYDAPWVKVHELLKNAALKTEKILKTPEPFVLQKSLNDFTITYELNAYTQDSHTMARQYSNLHENIQNEFNSAGVEILSPNYVAYRNGNPVQSMQKNID